MKPAPQCHAEDLADCVGSLVYRSLEGVERSTARYGDVCDELAFDVVKQLPKATASRATSCSPAPTAAAGSGGGSTISPLRDGRIVEAYSAFDSLELLMSGRLLAG